MYSLYTIVPYYIFHDISIFFSVFVSENTTYLYTIVSYNSFPQCFMIYLTFFISPLITLRIGFAFQNPINSNDV